MSNYIKTTDFAIKDTYANGDSRKVAKGADVDVEFNNIATAIATKYDSANVGIANGVAPLNSSALVTKTFQWTTTAYTDAANAFTAAQSVTTNASSGNLLSLTDSYTGSGSTAQVLVSAANNTQGVNIKLLGNGTTTPSKTLRVLSGTFQIINDAYNAVIWSLSDAGAVTATSFAGSGASLTGLNASNINAGSIGAAYVPSGSVTQYAGSMKCRNHPSRGGVNVTLQAGGSPSGGFDGDLFYIY